MSSPSYQTLHNKTLKIQQHQTSELEWESAEIWVDPCLCPTYILMLIKEKFGTFSIQNPAQTIKLFLATRLTKKAQCGY